MPLVPRPIGRCHPGRYPHARLAPTHSFLSVLPSAFQIRRSALVRIPVLVRSIPSVIDLSLPFGSCRLPSPEATERSYAELRRSDEARKRGDGLRRRRWPRNEVKGWIRPGALWVDGSTSYGRAVPALGRNQRRDAAATLVPGKPHGQDAHATKPQNSGGTGILPVPTVSSARWKLRGTQDLRTCQAACQKTVRFFLLPSILDVHRSLTSCRFPLLDLSPADGSVSGT